MPYCSSCGLPIPEGQGNVCSMCYGDISYGIDGYYKEWAGNQIRREEQEHVENMLDKNTTM